MYGQKFYKGVVEWQYSVTVKVPEETSGTLVRSDGTVLVVLHLL